GQDCDPDVVSLPDFQKMRTQRLERFDIERVERLGTIERDLRDVLMNLESHSHFHLHKKYVQSFPEARRKTGSTAPASSRRYPRRTAFPIQLPCGASPSSVLTIRTPSSNFTAMQL